MENGFHCLRRNRNQYSSQYKYPRFNAISFSVSCWVQPNVYSCKDPQTGCMRQRLCLRLRKETLTDPRRRTQNLKMRPSMIKENKSRAPDRIWYTHKATLLQIILPAASVQYV